MQIMLCPGHTTQTADEAGLYRSNQRTCDVTPDSLDPHCKMEHVRYKMVVEQAKLLT